MQTAATNKLHTGGADLESEPLGKKTYKDGIACLMCVILQMSPFHVVTAQRNMNNSLQSIKYDSRIDLARMIKVVCMENKLQPEVFHADELMPPVISAPVVHGCAKPHLGSGDIWRRF